MNRSLRLLAVCTASCVIALGLLVWLVWSANSSPVSSQQAAAAVSRSRPDSSFSLSSFVVPGMQAIDGAEQQVDVERVLRASPQAFFSRERSFTEFSHLGSAAVARVVRGVFPALIDQRDGGPPRLPAGERIVRYTASNIAQLVLPGRKRAVVESLGPMAKHTTSGRLAPIDLSLRSAGRSYVPASSDVSVQIPKRLSEGVRTPADSVSFTPVDAVGRPLSGNEGAVEGASVVYANTQTDTDTVAKPTSMGFELSAILRSVNSPRRLWYRVGLPAGASLVQVQRGGPVRIVSGGRLLGVVPRPRAVDAGGAAVPVSMSAQRDLLSVDVEGPASQNQYPVDADPEYYTGEDRSLTGGVFPVEEYKGGTNWKPIFSSAFSEATTFTAKYSCGPENWEWCNQSWYIEPTTAYNGGEYAGLEYKTQGDSTVYNLEMWLEGENEPSQTTTEVEYRFGPKNEGQDKTVVLSGGINQTRYKDEPMSTTSGYLNNPLETPRGNDVRIVDSTGQSESDYGFWTWIYHARVYVAQEESALPETSSTSACKECGFNTTNSTISEAGGRANVLYGSGSWLSPYQGAYEVTAHDPGVGVSFAAISGAGMSVEKFIRNKEGKCAGIQCEEMYKKWLTYNEKMANGDDQIELFAENATGMYGYSLATIKVDDSQPYNLGFTGMPEVGAEISAAPHQLTIHATDGTKPTPSSGVRSVAVSIDGGKEKVVPGASCPEGECTASGTYTLNGEELSEGVHRLVVSAVSNSGVPASSKEFLFDVRHASPVAVGPGSVDPVTGNLTLGATDVSLAGTGGVSRTYQSRTPTVGAGGPLGPQWTVGVGGGESLKVLPTGSVAVLSGSGGQTTYSLNSKGEFQSPKGDENLKMEYKAAEHKYVLSDANAGAETVFEQPKGTESTAPSYVNQFGSELGELNRPVSIATDAKGNMWVTDWTNDRIVEFSPEGALLKAYGSYGPEAGQMINPWGIAINQKTGNIYVTDYGNNRIDEFSSSGTFVETMGWGVNNGNAEYETCTSSCHPGIPGSGEGQFTALEGISIDSSGNIWIADDGNSRIQELNEANKYVTRFGSLGSGAGQFNGPMNVAFAGGDLYVTDENNNRIDEFSTTGSFIKAMGWGVSDGKAEAETCTSSCKAGTAGAGNGEFNHPRGLTNDPVSGNLYVSEQGNNRVQEITTTGVFVTKFGSGGSSSEQFAQPMGVVVGSTGGIYVTDFEHARVTEWLRSTWWPTSVKGALADHTTVVYTPVENSAGETSMYPYEVLSPSPSGVSCGTKLEELKIGCRALTFSYAKETTVKGEGEKRSEWAEYKGRLSKIFFHGYNPSSKAMEEKAVAQYFYDKQGRLRAEWDPRVESSTACGKTCSALKTTYGYDAEGHVTSLTPSGQESWAFTYGPIVNDANTGRLLKVTRAPASVGLWNGEGPKSAEEPVLSGTPQVGVTMGASIGKWSGSPFVFGFQWEDCNTEGRECVPILGATNENYKVAAGDVGHRLIAVVGAVNGGGKVTATTSASAVVGSWIGTFTYSSKFGSTGSGNGNFIHPADVKYSVGSLWVVDEGNSRLEKFNSKGEYQSKIGKEGSNNGELKHPASMAEGVAAADVWIADTQNNRVEEQIEGNPAADFVFGFGVAGKGAKLESCDSGCSSGIAGGEPGELNSPKGIAVGKGHIWVSDTQNGRIEEYNEKGEYLATIGSKGSGVGQLQEPLGIGFNAGNIWVADRANKRVLEFGEKGEYLKEINTGGEPESVAIGSGTVYVANEQADDIQVYGEDGVSITSFGSKGIGSGQFEFKYPQGIAAVGNSEVWVTNAGSNDVEKWVGAESVPSEGTTYSPQPGNTIEYRVPIAGTGLPTLTKEEVEKWGQKDKSEGEDNDPVEGMAVFPPDEPQGWPASGYKRATIDYLNAKGLSVNTATPTGGIATTEYNELNEAVRSLSADNRAAAMKEGCKSVSKKECKSAEVSEKLDTRTEYNAFGSDILKVLGPEHKIKLSAGSEVQARQVTHDYYNEDAQQAEEKNRETYNLLTKSTSGALLASGEEKDVRTTITSYNGQKDLGWKLRKPTSVATDPAGLDLVHTTVYNETTGDVVETKAPGGTSETVYPLAFTAKFGSEGLGKGQFNHPLDVALDTAGDIWVDDRNNDRLEKFSPTGTFIAEYGSKGSGNDQFSNSWALAINQSSGNIYVADTGNNRMEELNSSGEFVRTFGTEGTGKLEEPEGVTVDSSGDVWVSDSDHNRIVEFSSTGVVMREFGSYGTGNGQLENPRSLTISEGSLYVVDLGNDRVEQFSLTGSYLNQFGSKGSGSGQLTEPVGIAANPTSGDLFVSDRGNHRIEEFSPAGKYLTAWNTWSETHEISSPMGLTINAAGKLYVADEEGAMITEWLPPETGGAHLNYGSTFGSKGSGNGQFAYPVMSAIDGHGNIWVTDYGNHRIEEFSSTGTFIAAYGKYGSGNGEFEDPQGIDINQSTGDVYVADAGNNRIEEFSSTGEFIRAFGTSGSGELNDPEGVKIDSSGNVWVADTDHNRIVEFSSTGTYVAAYGSTGSGNGQFNKPTDIAFSGSNLYVTDSANHRVQELSNTGTYISQFGTEGSGSGEFYTPEGIAADSAGNLYVVDGPSGRVQEFTATGVFLASFATKGSGEGQLNEPTGITINAAGDMYVDDTGENRIEEWIPANQAAHDTQTIYYGTETNTTYPSCGKHPEWANLPCQTQLAAQPNRGLPELPVSTVASYNIWDEVEKGEEKFGTGSKAVTRIKTETYDPAGRALTSEVKEEEEGKESSNDAHLPTVTDEYNEMTGAVEKQSTSGGTITSKYNTLGQPTEYKDASGNVAKYTYEEGSDGRLEEVSEGKGKEAESKQTYSYNTTTGFMAKLIDTAAGMSAAQGTFTASYDVEGKMTSEVYPNGMCANTTYNSLGAATSLEYIKTRNCSETGAPVWFSDSVAPSIHGETLQQTSTLAKENYAYDNAGRLLETQETPAGKGCVVRLYAYEEESNRTSETKREPGTEGKCATEGGTVQRHTYDEANRLTDEGIAYETFGNITKMPAADAGEHEITSTYYVDNQLASETQNGETFKYFYDPSGRTMETTSEGKTSAKMISHYAGPGNALTWTSEGSEKWTRNIPGIDGALDAIQASTGSTVLQLHDLLGDIIGTAGDSESETKLLSTYNSTEFGVPQPGTTPPKYAWLGAVGVSSEPSQSAGVATESGSSYVPQVARALQTAPVIPPGAFPDGQPGTQYTPTISAGALESAAAEATRIFNATEAERQKAREREAAEALQKCQEEGGCGAEEGGAESVEAEEYDPEGLASYKTTMNRAKELRNDAVKGGVSGLVLDLLFPGAADAGAEYALGLEVSATSLDSCVEVGKQTSGKRGKWGTCFIHENKLLGIPVSAEAEFCGYEETRSWGKKTHSYYYCEGSGELISGPWY